MPKRRDILSIMEAPSTPPQAYWDDLRKVVEAELTSGKVRPPFPKLTAFLREEHGVTFEPTTVQKHYQKVKSQCQAK